MNDLARDEFLLARAGSLGASEVADILREGRGGQPSATRKNMLARKVCERLTGKPTFGFVSRAMQDGLDREVQAKRLFTLLTDQEIVPVPPPGIVPHPTIAGCHASPDGLIEDAGLYEGKAPEPAQHLAMLLDGKIATDYVTQIQWQLAVTRRSWCDFCSYSPDFSVAKQLWIKRVPRDPTRIVELETAVRAFLREVEETVERLK